MRKDDRPRREPSEERRGDAPGGPRDAGDRYRRALEAAGNGFWLWHLEAHRVEICRRFRELAALDDQPAEVPPEVWLDRVHSDDVDGLKRAISRHLAGTTDRLVHEHRLRVGGDGYRWVELRGRAVVEHGQPVLVTGTLADVDARKRTEKRLIHDAFHDALTGLPNASLLADRIEVALAQERRGRSVRFAILYLDLDRFKTVNDSLGHRAGDELLEAVALRLQTVVRPGDTVSRLSGDEFAILAPRVASADDADRIAQRVLDALSEPFEVGGHELATGASLGIALAGRGTTSAEELLRQSDSAMYRAKARGRGCAVLYDSAMHLEAERRRDREGELGRALDAGELTLRYLPVVDLPSGQLAGYEALLRWLHPVRGTVQPADFIPAAERSGLIVPIGRRVLRQACAQMAAWGGGSAPDRAICVNLSPRQFWLPDLVGEIEAALAESGLDPSRLELDLTEEAVMRDVEAAGGRLSRLRALGVRVQLDDFGTGFSSLDSLRRLPTDRIKIDRSFVSGASARSGERLLEGIVGLAQSLGIEVAAEGLETADQLERLRQLGCGQGQGFYFSRPLEPAAAADLAAGGRRW